ncbi:MAG: polysaccharide deacetylase family protein [Anaerolineales bacterium]|nr:polysaccharide deacetylase family protein [Anaerolineales bacterium]
MTPSPRLLLTIDYESWFAVSRRYDFLPMETRRQMDEEIARTSLDPILDLIGEAKATFYLVGEIVEWYPEIPQKIQQRGHEVGFHCHTHRRIKNASELKKDLLASANWIQNFKVSGYRAPMITTAEESYTLLKEHGFVYSSSLYAPTGKTIRKNGVWEIPVSTLALGQKPNELIAPRNMTFKLLRGGEFPYGSSFTSGLFPRLVSNIIEREFKAGKSPVIFLHPYELVTPPRWFQRFAKDLFLHPEFLPFMFNKSKFLKDLLHRYPTSTMQDYLKELQ